MAHLYHLKVKAGGNLHLLPLMRGVGYLFRPQLLSLLFYAIYIIIIALYVKNIQYLFKIYFLYGIKAFLFLYSIRYAFDPLRICRFRLGLRGPLGRLGGTLIGFHDLLYQAVAHNVLFGQVNLRNAVNPL